MKILVTAIYNCPQCNCQLTYFETGHSKYCLSCGKRMELVSASCRPIKKGEESRASDIAIAVIF